MIQRIYIDGGVVRHQDRARREGRIAIVLNGEELVEWVGPVTSNQAEYRALIRALQLARTRGAHEVEVLSDSELLVKQVNGEYRVRNADLRPLAEQAKQLRGRFDLCRVRWITRQENLAGQLLERQQA
jgi:ribonuclease HI